ncbi:hypothetical protein PBCVNEJV1_392L [Paramecium bursaria Chlorella virus NE-JV-1]|nr:hypothetical protein PBCVNEJV1_392L [Paramecium bursaria Chlorella virus NE-JV-1]
MVSTSDTFLLSSLCSFFEDHDNLKIMSDVIKNQSLSMRVLDWFVSNYSKKNNIFFVTKEGKHFNVYLEYKSSLKSYSKRFFDPFCRGSRITFKDHNGKEFLTTVGQLNFFRWAIKNELIQKCEEIVEDVENDMISAVRRRKNFDKSDSRRELNKARIKQCLTTEVKVTISFS